MSNTNGKRAPRCTTHNRRLSPVFRCVLAGTVAVLAAQAANSAPAEQVTSKGNGVYSVSIAPGNVNWGSSAKGTVQLMRAAPANKYSTVNGKKVLVKKGGATVLLKSSSSSVKVPSSVKVAPGALTASFAVTVSTPSSCSAGAASSATSTITATYINSMTAELVVGQSTGKPSRYTSKTIIVNPNSILGVSHDAHALILNGSDKCVQSLVAGDVLFFKNLGVLEVKKVMKAPQHEVAVAVASASLTDFINDGTFQVFKSTLGNATQPSGSWAKGLEPDQPASGDAQWKYSTSGSGASYSFTAFKQNGGLSASVTGHGEITKFGFNFLAVIHGDKLQQATYKVDMDGTLDVDWMAQTTGPGQGIGESRLRLPALHSGLVDSADGIPLLFQVYANLIFKPGFGEKAAAKGHFRVTYSGEGGLDGTTPLNEGLDAKTDIDSTTSSAKAAHGAVIAVNAPKYALSLSTVSFLWALDARLPGALNAKGANLADSMQGQLGTYVKGDLMPPSTDDLFNVRRSASVSMVTSVGYAGAGLLAMFQCQQYYQTFLALAGMDKDMLGTISGSIPPKKGIQVFKKEKTTIIPLIKGCEPKPN
jgi:hypothetical protein